MATIFQNSEENQQNSSQNNQQNAPVTMQGSLQTGTASSQVQGSNSFNQSQSGPFSQNRTNINPASNLQKYREANQTNVSGKLATGASKDVEQANRKFENIRNTFQQNQANIQNRYQQGQQFASQIPTGQFEGIAQDQNQLNAFGKIRDADTSDVDQLSTQLTQEQQTLNPLLNQARQTAQQFGTEEGRFNLLKRSFGQNAPSYNIGQQRLDQLLVQGDPNLRKLETGLKSNINNIERGVQGLESQVNEFIPTMRNQFRDLSGEVVNNLRGYEDTMQQQLTNLAKERTVADDQRIKDIQTRYNKKALTLDDLKFLGIDPQQTSGMIVKGWNSLTPYLDKEGEFTAQQVATAQDQAKFNALKQLAGNQIASEFDFNLDQIGGGPEDRYNLRTTDPFSQAYKTFAPTNDELYNSLYNNFLNVKKERGIIGGSDSFIPNTIMSMITNDVYRNKWNTRGGTNIQANDFTLNNLNELKKMYQNTRKQNDINIPILSRTIQDLTDKRIKDSLYSFLAPEARKQVFIPKEYGIGGTPTSGGKIGT